MYVKMHADPAGRLSWHVIRTWTRVPGRALTMCGRTATGESADAFEGERTCESCLRAKAKSEGI